jgi:hypothetical protein
LRISYENIFIFFWVLFSLTAFAKTDLAMQSFSSEISKHYAAPPSLYQLDQISTEQVSDLITRQYVMGAQSMLVKWTFKKGALIPMH